MNEKCGGLPATVRSLSSLASAGSTVEGALKNFAQIDIDISDPKAKVASWQRAESGVTSNRGVAPMYSYP